MRDITLHIMTSESSESSPSSNEVSHLTSESAAEASPFNIILNPHDFIFCSVKPIQHCVPFIGLSI